jgi:hypothetical protein
MLPARPFVGNPLVRPSFQIGAVIAGVFQAERFADLVDLKQSVIGIDGVSFRT